MPALPRALIHGKGWGKVVGRTAASPLENFDPTCVVIRTECPTAAGCRKSPGSLDF